MQVEIYELSLYGNQIPPCGSGSVTTVDWIETGCKRVCGDFSGEYPVIYEELCGEGCCLRRTNYCRTDGFPQAIGKSQITSLTPCTADTNKNPCDPDLPCNPVCNKL